MDLTLTWDLLIILFFAIVIAYSFIVGKEESGKIIVASYVAAIAVAGIGNLLDVLGDPRDGIGEILGFGFSPNILSSIKLLLFTAVIIILAVRGGFQIDYEKEFSPIVNFLITTFYGFATAGLLLCILLAYVAHAPMLSPEVGSSAAIAPLLGQSQMVPLLIDYQNVWFSVPAILLLGVGLWSRK